MQETEKRWEEQWIVVAKGGWSWNPKGSKWESKVAVRGRTIEIGSVGGVEVLVMAHFELWVTDKGGGQVPWRRSLRNWEARFLKESSIWALKSLGFKHSFNIMTVSHSSRSKGTWPKGSKNDYRMGGILWWHEIQSWMERERKKGLKKTQCAPRRDLSNIWRVWEIENSHTWGDCGGSCVFRGDAAID